jgi:3-methyladenine DNA glycosylase/8-oxoguanine DNA glycosylase
MAGGDAAPLRPPAWPTGTVLVREVVAPPWPFRLPPPSLDGLTRRRGDGLVRLVHPGGVPAVVQVARRGGAVVFAARAPTEAAARAGIARMRFATGVDDDLADFYERFRDDPVIGRSVRARPWLRVRRAPDPWHALLAAITEQLIETTAAMEIQRRMIAALGPRWAGLRDMPPAAAIAVQAPAYLESFGLHAKRAIALGRAAREVAAGRLEEPRLLAIPEIGRWTVEMVALYGLGRLDVVPAGDLGYLKLVGRLLTGRPKARAEEAEVRAFFARYAPYAGLAAEYLRLTLPRAGIRRSAAPRRSAAA